MHHPGRPGHTDTDKEHAVDISTADANARYTDTRTPNACGYSRCTGHGDVTEWCADGAW